MRPARRAPVPSIALSLLGRCRKAAAKPVVSDGKADGLYSTQRLIMTLAPGAPELGIGVAFEKVRDLVKVRRPRVATQQVPQSVRRSIAWQIDCCERCELDVFEGSPPAAFPEVVQAGELRSPPCGRPTGENAAPAPGAARDRNSHRAIPSRFCGSALGGDPPDAGPCRRRVHNQAREQHRGDCWTWSRREKQIQIVLCTKARIGHEAGSVREPLERDEFKSRGFERAARLLICEFRPLPAFRIVQPSPIVKRSATQRGNRSWQRSANGIANCVRWQNPINWRHSASIRFLSASKRGASKCSPSNTACA